MSSPSLTRIIEATLSPDLDDLASGDEDFSVPVDRKGRVIETGDILLHIETGDQYWVSTIYRTSRGHIIWCGMRDGKPLLDSWTHTLVTREVAGMEVIADPRDFLKEIPI